MGCVADAEQTGGRPLNQSIDEDGEKLDLVPGVDLGGAAGEEGNDTLDALMEGGEAILLDLRKGAFGDEVADLEVVVAIDENNEAAEVEVAERVFGVGGLARDAKPEDVQQNAFINEGEMTGDARDGVAAVAADGECGWDFDWTVRRIGENAGGEAVFLNESGSLPTHAESEAGKAGGLGGKEVEEVPLRHEGDEFGVGGKMAEVGYLKTLPADDRGEAVDLGVGKREEFVEEAEFVEKLEGGGMNGVAAEVSEEVFVFFKDGDGDALAGKKKAEHDACGASADDAGGGGERIIVWAHGWLRVASAGNGVKRNRDLWRAPFQRKIPQRLNRLRNKAKLGKKGTSAAKAAIQAQSTFGTAEALPLSKTVTLTTTMKCAERARFDAFPFLRRRVCLSAVLLLWLCSYVV